MFKRIYAPITLLAVLASQGRSQSRTPHSAEREAGPKLYTTVQSAMGTDFTLYLYSNSASEAGAVSTEVFEEIDRLDRSLSNYRQSSELSRINQHAADGPVTTDPETLDFLEQAEHWSRASDGAFDITVGRLMKAWGFYRHQGAIPPRAELDDLHSATGWQKVQIEPELRTVRFTAPGVELDPGGIGKGFAVDAAVRLLRADHVKAAMLSAGGSTIYALGAPPGRKAWSVVVKGPLPSNRTLSVLHLRDTSLSSADCSQKNFTADGHLYCHIMDPRQMRPVEGRIQVSIVDSSATASDALSNVLFVEPPEQSIAILKAYAPHDRALIISTDGKRAHYTTFGWLSSVRMVQRPSR